MVTQMPLDSNPADANNGYPFITYYLRSHFSFPYSPAGVSLILEDYLDDGAVFCLNGTEINRIRMPTGTILNTTLATTSPCLSGSQPGDAWCPDDWSITGALVTTNLIRGDNVLAVEVHNSNVKSHDITFGLSLTAIVPYAFNPTVTIAPATNGVVLGWTRGGFTLQQAGSVTGPWTNVTGPIFVSPYFATNSGTARFFRLHK